MLRVCARVYTQRMSKRIFKSHNVSVLVYHIVCPAKYRRVVFDEAVDEVLRAVCVELSDRYELRFVENWFG